jgi:hypothetical protein
MQLHALLFILMHVTVSDVLVLLANILRGGSVRMYDGMIRGGGTLQIMYRTASEHSTYHTYQRQRTAAYSEQSTEINSQLTPRTNNLTIHRKPKVRAPSTLFKSGAVVIAHASVSTKP